MPRKQMPLRFLINAFIKLHVNKGSVSASGEKSSAQLRAWSCQEGRLGAAHKMNF